LDIRSEPPVPGDPRALFAVIRAAFGQRRKQLGNTVASGLGLSKDLVTGALEGVGIDPRRRAETLSLEEFATLAEALRERLAP
jgi:16S rRNA (adenine1518-N6/adenine1519-N6)-dimethyltransferase